MKIEMVIMITIVFISNDIIESTSEVASTSLPADDSLEVLPPKRVKLNEHNGK